MPVRLRYGVGVVREKLESGQREVRRGRMFARELVTGVCWLDARDWHGIGTEGGQARGGD